MQGGGFSWILGWVNGAPPLGWPQTLAYLALPAALVGSQFITQRIMQPPSQDPQQQQSAAFLKFLPFIIGASPLDELGLPLGACSSSAALHAAQSLLGLFAQGFDGSTGPAQLLTTLMDVACVQAGSP